MVSDTCNSFEVPNCVRQKNLSFFLFFIASVQHHTPLLQLYSLPYFASKDHKWNYAEHRDDHGPREVTGYAKANQKPT